MKYNERFSIQIVIVEVKANGTHGDVYDNFVKFKSEKPESAYDFGYVVVDNQTGLVPDSCNDWNDSIDEAIFDLEENCLIPTECPENESERFPVKKVEIETDFGKISLEYPVEDNDDEKVRVFDSNGRYMDYLELSTFVNLVSENGTTLEHEIKTFANNLRSITNIRDLCDAIFCGDWALLVPDTDWGEIAKELRVGTKKEVEDNDFVNRIGNYLILVPEC